MANEIAPASFSLRWYEVGPRWPEQGKDNSIRLEESLKSPELQGTHMSVTANCYLGLQPGRQKTTRQLRQLPAIRNEAQVNGRISPTGRTSPAGTKVMTSVFEQLASALKLPKLNVRSEVKSDDLFAKSAIIPSADEHAVCSLDLPSNIENICRRSFQDQKSNTKITNATWTSMRQEKDRAVRQNGRIQARAARRKKDQQKKHHEQDKEIVFAKSDATFRQKSAKFASDNEVGEAESASITGEGRSELFLSFERRMSRRVSMAAAVDMDALREDKNKGKVASLAKMKSMREEKKKGRHVNEDQVEKDLKQLPDDERKFLKRIFSHHCRGSEGLHGEDLLRAILEAGLVAHMPLERQQLFKKCKVILKASPDGVTFGMFALEVVPDCRACLHRIRHDALLASLKPAGHPGILTHYRAVLECTKQVLPQEFYDESEDNEVLKKLKSKVEKAVKQFGEECEDASHVEELAKKLLITCEEWHRYVNENRRQIKLARGVDEENFAAFWTEMVQLDRLFQEVDEDGSNLLDCDEVETLFKELGVIPKTLMEKRKVASLLNESAQYDFNDFLKLVSQIRQMYTEQQDSNLFSSFTRHAAQNALSAKSSVRRMKRRMRMGQLGNQLVLSPNGEQEAGAAQKLLESQLEQEMMLQEDEDLQQHIGFDQLILMLVEAGVVPPGVAPNPPADLGPNNATLRRQRLEGYEMMDVNLSKISIEYIMQDVDPHGKELFHYPEVRYIVQRMREATRQKLRMLEEKEIKRLNFSKAQVDDFRELFNELDTRQSGWLTENSIDMALQLLEVQMERDVLARIAFRALDQDGSGTIDFLEFLRMLKMAERKEGPFKQPELIAVSTIEAMDRCDILLLLDALKVPISRTDGMDANALKAEAAERLEVKEDKNLHAIIGGATLKTLIKYAEEHAEKVSEKEKSKKKEKDTGTE